VGQASRKFSRDEQFMRRNDKEIKDPEEINEIMQKASYCHLGFVDGDEPYVIAMNYGYKDNSLYFHAAGEGRKLEIIKKNNKVCFEIGTDIETITAEKSCGWSMKYRTVVGTGRAYILEGDEAKLDGLRIFTGHYSRGEFGVPKGTLDKTAVIRVDIKTITGKKSGFKS
jgi:uncharacterized protein